MTDLVACLSTGKGTWNPVIKLINTGEFNNIFLITNEFGKENFEGPENVEMIVLNREMSTEEMKDKIKKELDGELEGTQIAVNLTSGSGKEHMALLSSVIGLGHGFRMVVPGENDYEIV